MKRYRIGATEDVEIDLDKQVSLVKWKPGKLFTSWRDSYNKNLKQVLALLDTTENKTCFEESKLDSPMVHFKRYVKTKYNIAHVSNAWLKGYELFSGFVLPMARKLARPLYYFDNACLPGGFVLAIQHLMETKSADTKLDWRACSLDPTKHDALTDTYGLFAQNKTKFFIDSKHDGDVRNPDTINFIVSQWKSAFPLSKGVDVYSSDIGFEVDDYKTQELEHAHCNFGQLVLGIHLLAPLPTSILITKQFTAMEPCTLSYLALLSYLFDTVHIVKPSSSTITNSESYIVAQGLNPEKRTDALLTSLLRCLATFKTDPILPLDVVKPMLPTILQAYDELYTAQGAAVNSAIQGTLYQRPISDLHLVLNPLIHNWLTQNYLVPRMNK